MSGAPYLLLRVALGALIATIGPVQARPASKVEQLVEQGQWAEAGRLIARTSAEKAACSWSAYDRAFLAHLRASYFEAAPAERDDAPARLAASCASASDVELRGAVLLLHGRVIYDRTPDDGDFTEADTILKRAWSLNGIHGSVDQRAENLFYLGLVQQFRRNWPEAKTLFEQSLKLAEQSNDQLAQSLAHRHLGFVAGQTGDAAGARAGAERSRFGWRRVPSSTSRPAISVLGGPGETPVTSLALGKPISRPSRLHGLVEIVGHCTVRRWHSPS